MLFWNRTTSLKFSQTITGWGAAAAVGVAAVPGVDLGELGVEGAAVFGVIDAATAEMIATLWPIVLGQLAPAI